MMFDALDTQRAFRALLSATASPGTVHAAMRMDIFGSSDESTMC